MTEDEFGQVQEAVAMSQRLHGKLHGRLIEQGMIPFDALIGSMYATYGLAVALHGNPVAAIEWLRTALDTIERQTLARQRPSWSL